MTPLYSAISFVELRASTDASNCNFVDLIGTSETDVNPYKRLAAGAALLRDLACTAWIDSGKPVPPVKPIDQMQNPENPKYNPATGSAAAAR